MTLFDDWLKVQKPDKKLPVRITAMYSLYGKTEGEKCGQCNHIICVVRSRTYFKCSQSRMSHGAATDWRMRWTACGKFEKGEDQ